MAELICFVCQSTFKRNVRGKDARLCCSRECGFTYLRWTRAKNRAFHEIKRELADWARPDRVTGFKIRIAALRHRLAWRDSRCVDCGEPTKGADFRKKCCDACTHKRKRAAARRSKQTPAGRQRKRQDRIKRKAYKRGATVETFDPIEVLERDGWRCHICGISTPMRLRGTYDDRAPELDHIIPLALGGEHSRLNTACACRKCNIAKGSQLLGQLRLVA